MTHITFRELLDIPLQELPAHALRPVRVAVLDTGVDATHAALKGRVIRATAYCIYPDSGQVACAPLPPKRNHDPSGHGTGVAAILADLAPNARLQDMRVLEADSAGYGCVVLRGLADAIEGDAEIINLSVAISKDKWWSETSRLLEEAYRRNKVVVASRRNFPRPGDQGLPAELPTAISVDAAAFSSCWMLRFLHRSSVEFAARGRDVQTAHAGGGWTRLTGTSFAAPVVSALCTLLRGANRDLTIFELKSILKFHAESRRGRASRNSMDSMRSDICTAMARSGRRP